MLTRSRESRGDEITPAIKICNVSRGLSETANCAHEFFRGHSHCEVNIQATVSEYKFKAATAPYGRSLQKVQGRTGPDDVELTSGPVGHSWNPGLFVPLHFRSPGAKSPQRELSLPWASLHGLNSQEIL